MPEQLEKSLYSIEDVEVSGDYKIIGLFILGSIIVAASALFMILLPAIADAAIAVKESVKF